MTEPAVDPAAAPTSSEVSSTTSQSVARNSPERVAQQAVHLVPVLIPLALLAVWEAYTRLAGVDPTVLPPPSRIVAQLYEFRGLAWEHTRQTIIETAVGFGASIAVAVLFAVAMDQITWVRRSLYPMMVASQTIPIIAIAPLMIIWFGFGLLPKVLVIILVTFFPIVVALLDGFASTEREAMNLLQTMGASKRQIFLHVRFPTALPYFFTGVRISATYAIVAAIFAEYVGAYTGLGIWMLLSKNAFRTDLVFAAILITAVLSVTLFLLVHVVARFTIPWYYAARRRPT